MRKLLLLIATWLPLVAYCDKTTVNVETEGTLEEVISNQEVLKITELVITGRITAEDIIYLRENIGKGRIANLETLDLKDVTLVASETPYYKDKYAECYLSDEERYEYEGRDGSVSAGGFWMEGAKYNFVKYYNMNLPHAFRGLALKKVVLPSSVHKIGDSCFYYTGIESVEAPGGITEIQQNAFCQSGNLQSISLPSGVEKVGYNAFNYCNSLESFDLTNATEIGESAFANCPSLVTVGSLAKVKQMGVEAFKDCSSLEGVIDLSSMTEIPSSAFQNCSKITEVKFGEGLISIGGCAFMDCYALATVNIPTTLKNVDYGCFEHTPWLNNYGIDEDGMMCINNVVLRYYIDNNFEPNSVLKFREGIVGIADGFQINWRDGKKPKNSAEQKIATENIIDMQFPSTLQYIGNSAFKGYTGLTKLVFPESLKKIGDYAFQVFSTMNHIESITFSEGLEEIGVSAFEDCTKLGELKLPKSLRFLGNNAFARCTGLSEITIPENVENVNYNKTRSYSETSSGAFNGCTGIINVRLEAKRLLKWIPYTHYEYGESFTSNILGKLEGLEKIVIGSQVEVIPAGFLQDSKPKTVVFEDRDKESNLFFGKWWVDMSNMPSIVYPDCKLAFDDSPHYYDYGTDIDIIVLGEITELGESCFSGISSLKTIRLSDELKEIPYQAFNGCSNLTSINMPKNLVSVGQQAFDGCISLENEIVFPDGFTTVSYSAFAHSGITSVTIPSSVTTIGGDAFRCCSNLSSVISLLETPILLGSYAFDFPESYCDGNRITWDTPTLYVPKGTVDTYKKSGWQKFKNILEIGYTESIISFADNAVKEICIQNWDTNKDGRVSEEEAAAVKALGELFKDSEIASFDELKYFTGLTTIDDWAFGNCAKLEYISLPATIQIIGRNAFTNCTAMTKMEIPASTTIVGESAFAGCKSLVAFTVTNENASLSTEDGILYNKEKTRLISCPAGKTGKVSLPETVTELDANSFYNCTEITEIVLPTILRMIFDAAFVGCSSLTTLAIPANVSSIGIGCFTGCTALKSITVDADNSVFSAPDGVLIVNNTNLMAYPNAKGDTYVVGEGITSIGAYAFCMTGIKSLTLPSTLKTISDYAISYCSNLTTITSYATVPPIVSATAFSEGTFSGAMLNVPIGCKESYSTTDVWKNFSNIVEIGKDGPEFITIGKSGKASYCGDKSLDFSFSDEIKAYIATGFDKDEGTIWLTRVKDVPAGVPVLIKGEANKTYDVPVTNSQNSYYTNMFVGNTTGEKIQIQETDGDLVNYYLSGDGTFKSVNKSANIGNNKCYLQLPGTFEPAVAGATQKVTIKDIGKASYAAPVDLDFTNVEGLKAFTATGYDKSTKTIWLTRVMKVQKGEGVLLKGDPNSYEIPSVAVQSSYENMFVGNTSGDEIQVNETSEDGSQTNYYLSGKDGSFVSVNGFAKIGDNKCYLALPTSMVAVSSTRSAEDSYKFEEPEVIKLPIDFKSIGSEGDGTTGVKEVKSGEAKSDEWFTLQGQRVAKPGKGLYIRNGKKVVIK